MTGEPRTLQQMYFGQLRFLSMSAQDRNSAVEILRILSMFFVVLVHFNRLGINPGIISATGELTLENGIVIWSSPSPLLPSTYLC